MRRLPLDVARCLGHECDRKERCLRFLAREDEGDRIVFAEFEAIDCVYEPDFKFRQNRADRNLNSIGSVLLSNRLVERMIDHFEIANL